MFHHSLIQLHYKCNNALIFVIQVSCLNFSKFNLLNVFSLTAGNIWELQLLRGGS
jgi:hypothetical protein